MVVRAAQVLVRADPVGGSVLWASGWAVPVVREAPGFGGPGGQGFGGPPSAWSAGRPPAEFVHSADRLPSTTLIRVGAVRGGERAYALLTFLKAWQHIIAKIRAGHQRITQRGYLPCV